MQDDPTIAKAGSIAAFGVALSYLASSLCAVLMPPELQGRPDVPPHQFWTVLSQDPLAHLAFHWSWVAAGFFGLGAVPAISLVVWSANRGAVLWSAAAAFSGFAVLARSHLMEVAFDRRIIPHYRHALWFGIQKRDRNIYLPCVGWIALDSGVIVGVVIYG